MSAAEDYLPYDWVPGDFDDGDDEGLVCRTCGMPGLRYKQLPSGKWWLINIKGEWHEHIKEEGK